MEKKRDQTSGEEAGSRDRQHSPIFIPHLYAISAAVQGMSYCVLQAASILQDMIVNISIYPAHRWGVALMIRWETDGVSVGRLRGCACILHYSSLGLISTL